MSVTRVTDATPTGVNRLGQLAGHETDAASAARESVACRMRRSARVGVRRAGVPTDFWNKAELEATFHVSCALFSYK